MVDPAFSLRRRTPSVREQQARAGGGVATRQGAQGVLDRTLTPTLQTVEERNEIRVGKSQGNHCRTPPSFKPPPPDGHAVASETGDLAGTSRVRCLAILTPDPLDSCAKA